MTEGAKAPHTLGKSKMAQYRWADKGNRPENEEELVVNIPGHEVFTDLVGNLGGCGIEVIPSHSGAWCGLDLRIAETLNIQGLTLDTQILRSLHPHNPKDLERVVKGLGVDKNRPKSYIQKWMEFSEQLITKQSDPNTTLAKLAAGRMKPGAAPLISWDATGAAQQVVPQRSWFPQEIQNLTSDQLLALFPPAEREAFLLLLGRILAGVLGDTTIEGVRVNHHFRQLTVIQGPPGMGKSLLFSWLIEALKALGYSTVPWDITNEKFGMVEAAEASMAFCDDVKKLQKVLELERMKQWVSGGEARMEKKGVEHLDVHVRAAFVACTNELNFSGYLESGSFDRLYVLSTYTDNELVGEVDKRPKTIWDNLCKQFNCNHQVLATWLLRLGFEKFLKTTGYDLETYEQGQDKLEETSDQLRDEFAYQIDLNHVRNLIRGLVRTLAAALINRNDKDRIVSMAKSAPFSLQILLPYLKLVAYTENWNQDELTPFYPVGLSLSSTESLKGAIEEYGLRVRTQEPKKLFLGFSLHLISIFGIGFPHTVIPYQRHWKSELERIDYYINRLIEAERVSGIIFADLPLVGQAGEALISSVRYHKTKSQSDKAPSHFLFED